MTKLAQLGAVGPSTEMLSAERDALAAEVWHGSLNIVERELNILLGFMTNVGTLSALLGGFAFSLLGDVGEDVHPVLECLFLSTGVLCFGCFMYVVLISTLCASLAPRKAFKDREKAAMRVAIAEMEVDKRRLNRVFNMGVLLFMVLVVLLTWLNLHDGDWPIFVVVTVLVSGVTVAIYVTMHHQYKRYSLNAVTQSNSGVMKGAEFVNMTDTVTAMPSQTMANKM